MHSSWARSQAFNSSAKIPLLANPASPWSLKTASEYSRTAASHCSMSSLRSRQIDGYERALTYQLYWQDLGFREVGPRTIPMKFRRRS